MTVDFRLAVQQGLLEGRALAESLMTDTCAVRYQTGRTTPPDPVTNEETPVMATRFTSACRVRQVTTSAADVDVAGRREQVDQTRIDLPVSAPQVELDDEIEITAVGTASDSRLVGRKFIVGPPMNQTFSTATRLRVREAS